MKNKITVFPHSSGARAGAMSAADIQIDGMKVLFDKRIDLAPAQLEKAGQRRPKKRRAKNGR